MTRLGAATRLGVVTGLAFEADILGRRQNHSDHGAAKCDIRIAGADAARAHDAARDLIGNGATALMSFGVAGALDPALSPGDVVIATRILGPGDNPVAADAGWTGRLTRLVENACHVINADLAAADGAVATVAAKAALFRATGAVAVDMESHGVARAARDAGVPFCAIRAIADPAGRELPDWVSGVISTDGKTRPAAVLSALFGRSGRPRDIGKLVRLARDNRAAKASLARIVLAGGPGFGVV